LLHICWTTVKDFSSRVGDGMLYGEEACLCPALRDRQAAHTE